eukprot:6179714-Pleurochrysis_carterae.AAC.1
MNGQRRGPVGAAAHSAAGRCSIVCMHAASSYCILYALRRSLLSVRHVIMLNMKFEYLASDNYAESPASQLVIVARKAISNITRTRNY